MGELDGRKKYTAERFKELQKLLISAADISKGRACAYATGSYGRLEAGGYSDLDLCIVARCDENRKSQLAPLDEICVKAEIISAVRKANLPEIDGDGRYLGQFTNLELIESIGAPDDDVKNTFTSRMLLLLESKPIFGDEVYIEAKNDIISAYWLDYIDNKDEFIPAYLSNDILRLWRTFCVNYEARTRDLPADKASKRKIKNYKLKHSRIMTCYSAIIYLLAIYKLKNTVSPADAVEMTSLSPMDRLSWVLEERNLSSSHKEVSLLIDQYEHFLQIANGDEEQLIDKVLKIDRYTRDDYKFGEIMFDAVNSIGGNSKFHRLIVV